MLTQYDTPYTHVQRCAAARRTRAAHITARTRQWVLSAYMGAYTFWVL